MNAGFLYFRANQACLDEPWNVKTRAAKQPGLCLGCGHPPMSERSEDNPSLSAKTTDPAFMRGFYILGSTRFAKGQKKAPNSGPFPIVFFLDYIAAN